MLDKLDKCRQNVVQEHPSRTNVSEHEVVQLKLFQAVSDSWTLVTPCQRSIAALSKIFFTLEGTMHPPMAPPTRATTSIVQVNSRPSSLVLATATMATVGVATIAIMAASVCLQHEWSVVSSALGSALRVTCYI